MDLASILAELKSVEEIFKQPDTRLATAAFCQRADKALDKVVAEAGRIDFDHLVVGIWIVIGSFNELLPQLVDGPLLTQLVDKLFRQCARVVLDIKWQQLGEDTECRKNFQASLSTCHQQMAPRGFTRFSVLQSLMDNPWTDPVLTMVMGNEEDNEEGEGLAYIQAQDPEILKLRVELMQQENCDEFALNLCTWCLKHPALAQEFDLRKTQFVLLHRLSSIDRLQEECQTMSMEDSIRLIKILQGREEHKELCTMLAQTFLVQNWIKPSDNDAKKELLQLWIKLQYQADEDQDRFISSLWAVAKVSHSTEQLLFIIDAVREQCGDTFLQFYLDLCVFAINVDKGCWEKLKESNVVGPNEELQARKRDIAQVCNKLAHIVAHVSPKISFCCALTAFSLLPTEQSLQGVYDAHQRRSQADIVNKSQCCSNCAADQGGCLKNADSDKASRDVNIATLYEVERLCGMLRPSYLSSDSDISVLLSLCKQYLLKENGEAVKSALVRRKSVPAAQQAPPIITAGETSPWSSVSGISNSTQNSKPNILRGSSSVSKTADVALNVSNMANLQNPNATHKELGAGLATDLQQKILTSPGSQSGQQAVTADMAVSSKPTSLTGAQASSQSPIQQLVLKQLSSDVVQTLLHLIESRQISAVHLSHIMTKTPSVSLQVIHNLVSQAKQTVEQQKATSQQPGQQPGQQPVPQQPQQLQQPVQMQQIKQQQLHLQQLQQLQQQQVQQQQSKTQRQQTILKQQMLQQPTASQTTYDTSHVLQSSNLPQPRIVVQHAGIQQHVPQGKIAQGQSMVQQSAPSNPQPIRPRPPSQSQSISQTQPQMRTVQQIGPLLSSLPTLRLSSTGEIHVTQPVHVMTFRHPAPLQSSATGTQRTQLLMQNSRMLTHLSGGSVMSAQQHPQSLSSAGVGSQTAKPTSKASPKLIPKAPGPGAAMQALSSSMKVVSSQASGLSGDTAFGNRHYSINNLLFTGEQQNSTLSISLPDKLPEISVDSISDTLRALDDTPTASGQLLPRVQQVQTSVPQAMSQATLKVSAPSGIVSSPQTQQKKQTPKSPKPAKKNTKKSAVKTSSTHAKLTSSTTTSSSQQSHKLFATLASFSMPTSSVQSQGQSLPSFSSLFSSSRSSLPVPSPSTISRPSTATDLLSPVSTSSAPAPPSKKRGANQDKGQKKETNAESAGNKGGKKDKDTDVTNKKEMMRLLKQAMTINVEKPQFEKGDITYVGAAGSSASVSHPTSVALIPTSSMPVDVSLLNQSAANTRIQKLPQYGQHTISVQAANQSIQVSTSVDHLAPTVPSFALSTSTSSVSMPGSAISVSASQNNQQLLQNTLPSLHDILTSKQTGAQEKTRSAVSYGINPSLPSESSSTVAISSARQSGKPVDINSVGTTAVSGILYTNSAVDAAVMASKSHAFPGFVGGTAVSYSVKNTAETNTIESSVRNVASVAPAFGSAVTPYASQHSSVSYNAEIAAVGGTSWNPAASVVGGPVVTSATRGPVVSCSVGSSVMNVNGNPSVMRAPELAHAVDAISLKPRAPATISCTSTVPVATNSLGSIQDTVKTSDGQVTFETSHNQYMQQNQIELGNTVPLHTNNLPENGTIEINKNGEQSFATYRCIICAKAFMTLDALRLHVKRICKPDSGVPGSQDDGLAKVQASDEGLETSTVFQCMRCYELCISEAGIRAHKLVCKKAPKGKAKTSKSKAKPKPPKSEAEQATEARVMELLNKCLGENREKLLEEAQAQAAKKSNSKRKPSKKKTAAERELGEASDAPKPKKAKKEKKASTKQTEVKPVSTVGIPGAETAQTQHMDTAGGHAGIDAHLGATSSDSSAGVSFTDQSSEMSLVASVASNVTVTSESNSTPVLAAKPKPKRKYYPKKKKPVDGADKGGSQFTQGMAGNTDSGVSNTTSEAQKSESVCGKSEGSKTGSKQKPKKESALPHPRFKKLSGSGGRSFYKCLNCGQTLCSIENFRDHWQECIVKKPPAKPKRAPKEKKVKTSSTSSSKISTSVYSSLESIDAIIASVASGSFASDTSQSEEVTNQAVEDREAETANPEESGTLSNVLNSSQASGKLSASELTELTLKAGHVLENVMMSDTFTAETSDRIEQNNVDSVQVETVRTRKLSGSLNDQQLNALFASGSDTSVATTSELSPRKMDLPKHGLEERDSQKSSCSPSNSPQKSEDSTKFCHLCQRSFSRHWVLLRHFAGQHIRPVVNKTENGSTFTCPFCPDTFPEYAACKIHIMSHSDILIQKCNNAAGPVSSATSGSEQTPEKKEEILAVSETDKNQVLREGMEAVPTNDKLSASSSKQTKKVEKTASSKTEYAPGMMTVTEVVTVTEPVATSECAVVPKEDHELETVAIAVFEGKVDKTEAADKTTVLEAVVNLENVTETSSETRRVSEKGTVPDSDTVSEAVSVPGRASINAESSCVVKESGSENSGHTTAGIPNENKSPSKSKTATKSSRGDSKRSADKQTKKVATKSKRQQQDETVQKIGDVAKVDGDDITRNVDSPQVAKTEKTDIKGAVSKTLKTPSKKSSSSHTEEDKQDKIEGGDYTKYCKVCDRFFCRRWVLVQHIASQHLRTVTVKRLGKFSSYLCHFCHLAFPRYNKYTAHIPSHSNIIFKQFNELKFPKAGEQNKVSSRKLKQTVSESTSVHENTATETPVSTKADSGETQAVTQRKPEQTVNESSSVHGNAPSEAPVVTETDNIEMLKEIPLQKPEQIVTENASVLENKPTKASVVTEIVRGGVQEDTLKKPEQAISENTTALENTPTKDAAGAEIESQEIQGGTPRKHEHTVSESALVLENTPTKAAVSTEIDNDKMPQQVPEKSETQEQVPEKVTVLETAQVDDKLSDAKVETENKTSIDAAVHPNRKKLRQRRAKLPAIPAPRRLLYRDSSGRFSRGRQTRQTTSEGVTMPKRKLRDIKKDTALGMSGETQQENEDLPGGLTTSKPKTKNIKKDTTSGTAQQETGAVPEGSATPKVNTKHLKKDSAHSTPETAQRESGDENKYCKRCKRYFCRRWVLAQHISSQHAHPFTVKKEGGTSSFICHLCNKIFMQYSLYMAHVPSHSSIIIKKYNNVDCPKERRSKKQHLKNTSQKSCPEQNDNDQDSLKDSSKATEASPNVKEEGDRKRLRKVKLMSTSSILAAKRKAASSQLQNRRSGRVASSQASSRLSINSQEMKSPAELSTQTKKRKITCEEHGTGHKLKRRRTENSSKERIKSDMEGKNQDNTSTGVDKKQSKSKTETSAKENAIKEGQDTENIGAATELKQSRTLKSNKSKKDIIKSDVSKEKAEDDSANTDSKHAERDVSFGSGKMKLKKEQDRKKGGNDEAKQRQSDSSRKPKLRSRKGEEIGEQIFSDVDQKHTPKEKSKKDKMKVGKKEELSGNTFADGGPRLRRRGKYRSSKDKKTDVEKGCESQKVKTDNQKNVCSYADMKKETQINAIPSKQEVVSSDTDVKQTEAEGKEKTDNEELKHGKEKLNDTLKDKASSSKSDISTGSASVEEPKSAEKGSEDGSAASSLDKHGQEKSLSSTQAEPSKCLSLPSSNVSKPSASSQEKLSFIDSFVSFVTNRSPDAPLPLGQPRKRFSSFSSSRVKESSGAATWCRRRSSEDTSVQQGLNTAGKSQLLENISEGHAVSNERNVKSAVTNSIVCDKNEQLTRQDKIKLGDQKHDDVLAEDTAHSNEALNDNNGENVDNIEQFNISSGPEVNSETISSAIGESVEISPSSLLVSAEICQKTDGGCAKKNTESVAESDISSRAELSVKDCNIASKSDVSTEQSVGIDAIHKDPASSHVIGQDSYAVGQSLTSSSAVEARSFSTKSLKPPVAGISSNTLPTDSSQDNRTERIFSGSESVVCPAKMNLTKTDTQNQRDSEKQIDWGNEVLKDESQQVNSEMTVSVKATEEDYGKQGEGQDDCHKNTVSQVKDTSGDNIQPHISLEDILNKARDSVLPETCQQDTIVGSTSSVLVSSDCAQCQNYTATKPVAGTTAATVTEQSAEKADNKKDSVKAEATVPGSKTEEHSASGDSDVVQVSWQTSGQNSSVATSLADQHPQSTGQDNVCPEKCPEVHSVCQVDDDTKKAVKVASFGDKGGKAKDVHQDITELSDASSLPSETVDQKENQKSLSMMEFLQKSAFSVFQSAPASELSEASTELDSLGRTETMDNLSASCDETTDQETAASLDADVTPEDDWDTSNDKVNFIALPVDNQTAPVSSYTSVEENQTSQQDKTEDLVRTVGHLDDNKQSDKKSLAESEGQDCKSDYDELVDSKLQPSAESSQTTYQPSKDLSETVLSSHRQLPANQTSPPKSLCQHTTTQSSASDLLREEGQTSDLPKCSTSAGEVAASKCKASTNVPGKTSSEVDPDSDLPELCIEPDPETIRHNKDAKESSLRRQSRSSSLDDANRTYEKKTRLSSSAARKRKSSLCSMDEVHKAGEKRKSESLLPDEGQKKRQSELPPAKKDGGDAEPGENEGSMKNVKKTRRSKHARTYCIKKEVRKEKVSDALEEEPEHETDPQENLSRKPLLGVKSLRNVHKPEPFIWDVEGEEHRQRQARNERSLRAFKQKVSVAPFSWESKEAGGPKTKTIADGAHRPEMVTITHTKRLQDTLHEESSISVELEQSDKKTCSSDSSLQVDSEVAYSRNNALNESENKHDSDLVQEQTTMEVDCKNHQGLPDKASSEVVDLESNVREQDSGYADSKNTVNKNTESNEYINSDEKEESDIISKEINAAGDTAIDKTLENTDSSAQSVSEFSKGGRNSEVSKSCTVPTGDETRPEKCSTEKAQLTTRSRSVRRSGASDQTVQKMSTRSASRTRKTTSSLREKPFRKSRSCDIETSHHTELKSCNKTLTLTGALTDQSATNDLKADPSVKKSARSPSGNRLRLRRALQNAENNGGDSVATVPRATVSQTNGCKQEVNMDLQQQSSGSVNVSTRSCQSSKIKKKPNSEVDGGGVALGSKPANTEGQVYKRSTRSQHSAERDINKTKTTDDIQENENHADIKPKTGSILSNRKSLRSRETSPDKKELQQECGVASSSRSAHDQVSSKSAQSQNRSAALASSTDSRSLRSRDRTPDKLGSQTSQLTSPSSKSQSSKTPSLGKSPDPQTAVLSLSTNNTKSLQNRDTRSDQVEHHQSIATQVSSKTVQSRDGAVNKPENDTRSSTPDASALQPVTGKTEVITQDSCSERGVLQDEVLNTELVPSSESQTGGRTRGRRASSNSRLHGEETVPASSVDVVNSMDKKVNISSSNESAVNAAESVSTSVSDVQTPKIGRPHRSRERKPVEPNSSSCVSKSTSLLQTDPAVSSVKSDQFGPRSPNHPTTSKDSSKTSLQQSGAITCKSKYRQSKSSQQSLGAMVHRRQQPTSWRKTVPSPAKKRRLLTSQSPQYEIIRVEPVTEDSTSDHRRTRSSDRDQEPCPRTVHTRVSVDKLKPAFNNPESGKGTNDQKWSIDRHHTHSEARKRSVDTRFPFRFKRARKRTETK